MACSCLCNFLMDNEVFIFVATQELREATSPPRVNSGVSDANRFHNSSISPRSLVAPWLLDTF